MAATSTVSQASGHTHTSTSTAMKYRTTNSGSPLSHADVDDNFELLRQAINGVIGDIDGVVDKNLTSDLSNSQLGYTENSNNYPVELGKNSSESSNTRLYVNVPWTDTTYSTATTSTLGLVKLLDLATANSLPAKSYMVQLNGSGQMYVNVPWTDTDTNTTYGIATSSTAGLVKSGGDVTVFSDGTMSVTGGSGGGGTTVTKSFYC